MHNNLEVPGLRASAQGVRDLVIDLQQVPGGAAAPSTRDHVAAAAIVTLPDPSFDGHRDGAAVRCTPLRRRSDGSCRLRRPTWRRTGSTARVPLRLRRRSLVAANGPTARALTARRPARVVAIEPLAGQPPDELPQRHVRVHVRQQPPQPLQPTVTLGVDDDLHLVAAGAQRPHLVARDRQLGVHAGQQLLYLPRALAGRLRHQRLPRGPVQHRRRFQRLDSRRWRQQRLLPRHGRPAPHDGAAPSALPVALLTVECALQLSSRAQGERSVLQPFAHLLELGAEVHGVDAPRGGGVGIAELAHHVVEQAGEAAAEIQPARLDLAQMVDDGDLELHGDRLSICHSTWRLLRRAGWSIYTSMCGMLRRTECRIDRRTYRCVTLSWRAATRTGWTSSALGSLDPRPFERSAIGALTSNRLSANGSPSAVRSSELA